MTKFYISINFKFLVSCSNSYTKSDSCSSMLSGNAAKQLEEASIKKSKNCEVSDEEKLMRHIYED